LKGVEGWKVDRKIEFLDEFQHIINDVLQGGVATFITEDDYQYYCGLNWPKKSREDSKYALLFRGCMAHMVDTIVELQTIIEPHLYVVLKMAVQCGGCRKSL
jgi:hypothetical protein